MGAIAQKVRTGLLEKADPLPPGRYWLDVYNTDVWAQWVNSHAKPIVEPELGVSLPATVIIVKTAHFPADEANGYPAGDWVLFDVVAPTPWGVAKDLGWPDIATPDIHGPEDTVQRPPPQTPGNFWFGSAAEGNPGLIPKWVPWAIGGVIVLVAGVTIVRLVRDE